VYFVDSGLVCHLLGIDSLGAQRSAFSGRIFEASERNRQSADQPRQAAREIYFSPTNKDWRWISWCPPGPGRLRSSKAKSTRPFAPLWPGAAAFAKGEPPLQTALVVCPVQSSGFGGLQWGQRLWAD